MRTSRWAFMGFLGVAVLGAATPAARADDPNTISQAFAVARNAVAPALQTKVVSVYGLGKPAGIDKWYIIFYDAHVPSHGRAVLVQDGKIIRTYDAKGGTVYSSKLTFDPSRITSDQSALAAARHYATKHAIAYNGVRALLKQVSLNEPFRWRIELTDGGTSRGYVMVNAVDDTVAVYIPPSHSRDRGTGSVSDDAQDFGHDVQHTFLGIGGDLQEFFTGERTVDKDQ